MKHISQVIIQSILDEIEATKAFGHDYAVCVPSFGCTCGYDTHMKNLNKALEIARAKGESYEQQT